MPGIYEKITVYFPKELQDRLRKALARQTVPGDLPMSVSAFFRIQAEKFIEQQKKRRK